jgi:hypothetical protein
MALYAQARADLQRVDRSGRTHTGNTNVFSPVCLRVQCLLPGVFVCSLVSLYVFSVS